MPYFQASLLGPREDKEEWRGVRDAHSSLCGLTTALWEQA